MRAPRYVREQAEAANARIREMNAPVEEPTPDEPVASTGTPERAEAPEAPAQEDPPKGDAFEPHVEAPGETLEVVQQRFKSLQGKYNAEVPRLRAENKELKQQLQTHSGTDLAQEVEGLKRENSLLKQQLQDKQTATPEIPAGANLDQLRAEYGDLVDGIANAVRAEMRREIDPIKQRVDSVDQGFRTMSAQQKFAELSRSLKAEYGINFEAMNGDSNFVAWLSQYDPLTGVRRQDALQRAFDSGNLEHATVFFTEFAGQHPQTGSRDAAPDLTKHVPVPSSAPTVDVAPQAQTFTGSQIKEFYDRKRRGAYSAEEAERLERQIFAATSEGRVTAG